MGRTYTFRRVTAQGWHKEPDGAMTGIIRLVYLDKPGGEEITEPAYYFGTIPDPGPDTPEGTYQDALRIIGQDNKISAERVQEIKKSW